jgi:hypothetical protein
MRYAVAELCKYAVPVLCGVEVILLIAYLTFFYQFPEAYIPQKVPSGNMDVHAVTASALQSNADLLVTIAIALTALFGFSISNFIQNDTIIRDIGVVLMTLFGFSLTFVFVYAYGVYHAIVIQTEHDEFRIDKIDPLVNSETHFVMLCAVLSVGAFCWRCTAEFDSGEA